MKPLSLLPLMLAFVLLRVTTSQAGPPPGLFTFSIATSLDAAGPHELFIRTNTPGTYTESFANDSGSGSATGILTGGLNPSLDSKANLVRIAPGIISSEALLQIDYYGEVDGPPGTVTVDFAGNMVYPNPLPTSVTGSSLMAFASMTDPFLGQTTLGSVNTANNPMVSLPATGVPGNNLKQSFSVTANSAFHIHLTTDAHVVNESGSYEIALDPTITINAAFAAAHPGYTLSFSPGFGLSLQIQALKTNVVLSWPVSASGYVLQATTNLVDTNSWATVTNVPVTVDSANTVTNPILGPRNFYRLKL